MDRFMRGLIAGLTGAIAMNLWSYFSFFVLKYSKMTFMQWAAILALGHKAANAAEVIFAQAAQFTWAAVLGIIFAFLVPQITSRDYLLKGAFWGFATGFLQFVITKLFQVPGLETLPIGTAVSNAIGAIIWGLVMAQTLYLLDNKIEIKHD